MKKAMFATAVIASCFAITTTADAKTTMAACSYKPGSLPSVSLTLSGTDLIPVFCQVFNRQFHGTRYYGYKGRAFCSWSETEMDINVTVYARSSFYGRTFCSILASKIDDANWYRTR